MTTAREAPQELLRLACAPGPLLERCQFAETAAALASQTSDDDLGYRARMWLTDLAFTAGAEDCMIASFDWCRAKNAADPARFPAELEAGPALVWQFQRVLKVFGESAHHPVEAGEELLADLAHHCAVAGLAEGVVVAAAFRHAWATGQLERARALAEAFAALPPTKRGGGSGLPAWELAVFAADDGDDPEAARLADEAMEGSSPDGYGVCRAIAASLLPRLRLGQAEEAEHLHSGGYERVGQDPACWAAVADHLAFCAVAGEPQRAGDLAARHIGWLLSDPLSAASHRGRLRLATGVLMALATAHHAGLGDQPIEATKDPRLAGYLRLNGAGKVWTASDVLPSLLGAASRWAARFDARNGNYHVSDWLARMLALAGAGWEPSAGPDPFEAAGAVDPASPGAAGDSASAAEVYRINMAEVQRAIAAACADGDRGLVADLLVNKACAMAKSGLPASAATDFFRAADAYRSAAMPLDSLRAGLWAAQVIAERLDRPADAAVILADLSHQIAALPVGQEMNEIAQEIAQEIARIGHHIGLEAALGDPLAALSG